jgi:Zn-dependent protease/CBS domain-containing protein
MLGNFGKRYELFKLFGFQVYVDPSWFVVFALLTWSMAVQYFPSVHPDLPRPTAWAMGVAGALLLFASLLLHEVSHALMARRFGLSIKGITLFIFGGVAELRDEPPTPQAEFLVAVAGPVASLVIAAAAFGFWGVARAAGWPVAVVGVAQVVATLNAFLVVFNAIPAFPLDGGRMLRSLLWRWKGDLRWATRVTSGIGSFFGAALIVLGGVRLFTGDVVGGIWMALIGLFVRSAARMSYQQLLLRRAFEGEPVRRFMLADPVVVPRQISVAELVEEYVYRHHHKMFPVVDGDRLVGCVTTRDVKALPREEWERQTVGAIAVRPSAENSVGPETDALQALALMSKTGLSRLLVVEGDRLLGILALKDLLKFFGLKIELEGAGAP